MRRLTMLVALLLAACGGAEETPSPSKLSAAEPMTVTWKIQGDSLECPGAGVRHDYTNTGIHVVFCTWACGNYTATAVSNADHQTVTLELGQMPSGWELLSEKVEPDGLCL